MNDALKLAVVSAILFLMLWFCYESKPQEITLWLMGGSLVTFLIATIAVGLETRRQKLR